MTVTTKITNLFINSTSIETVATAREIVKSMRPNASSGDIEEYLISCLKEANDVVHMSKTLYCRVVNWIKYRKAIWGKCDICGHKEVLGYHYFNNPEKNHDYYEVEICSRCTGNGQIWEMDMI